MIKKQYILSIICFLLIPVITVAGFICVNLINPEWAISTSHYERNFRLITMAKSALMLGILFVDGCLWLLTFFFALRSKGRSYKWMGLALLGPFGLAILIMLKDASSGAENLYQHFVGRLNIYQRILYETAFFIAAWMLSYQVVVIKRNLMIMIESARTGVSKEQIIQIQNASSGMWAFGEGLESMCLFIFFYLLWPVCFNVIGNILKRRKTT